MLGCSVVNGMRFLTDKLLQLLCNEGLNSLLKLFVGESLGMLFGSL